MSSKKLQCNACGERHEPPRGKKCKRSEDEDNNIPKSDSAKLDSLLSMVTGLKQRVDAIEVRQTPANPPEDGINLDNSSQDTGANVTASQHMDSRSADTLSSLRADSVLQRKVAARLSDIGLVGAGESDDEDMVQGQGRIASSLANKVSQKSGRAKTAADNVVIPVEWPHFHVFKGGDRSPAQYDGLSVQEFVFGYTNVLLKAGLPSDDKEAMLLHLRNIMLDACEYGWAGARNAHAIVLQQIEQGRLTWSDTALIQDIRRTYGQRVVHNASKGSASIPPSTCPAFQRGSCGESSDHYAGDKWVRHICSHCAREGKHYSHAGKDCRRKKQEKNGETGDRQQV